MPVWMKWAVSILIGFLIVAVGFKYSGILLKSFFILNCFVLIVVVLLQSGKAADLAGAFGGAGSQTTFGPRGAANLLTKATTWCAVMFMICALAMLVRTDQAVEHGNSVLQNVSKPASKPAPATSKPIAPQTNLPQPSGTPPASTPQPAPSQPKKP